MATKALKDKIRKHIEDHLCITDEYAKVAYNVDDLRPIINDLIQLDGMNITPKPYEENGKQYILWSYDPRKHVPTCKDCANRDACVDFERGDSRPCIFMVTEDTGEAK